MVDNGWCARHKKPPRTRRRRRISEGLYINEGLLLYLKPMSDKIDARPRDNDFLDNIYTIIYIYM